MDDKETQEKPGWHWVVFGPLTPFFRKHGFRELSKRESIGLILLSAVTISLVILAFIL